jgi:hypothetical protein
VRRGLDICRERGHRIVVVVGHPGFYPRFEFTPGLAAHLASKFSGRDSFMAAELKAGALEGVVGRLRYPPPFGLDAHVRPVAAADEAEWLRMRTLLWPDVAGEHTEEIRNFFAHGCFTWSEPFLAMAVFVAQRHSGGLCGFLEASVRPYAEGCATRPVGYVEGWFVDANARRLGIGRGLVRAAAHLEQERVYSHFEFRLSFLPRVQLPSVDVTGAGWRGCDVRQRRKPGLTSSVTDPSRWRRVGVASEPGPRVDRGPNREPGKNA